MTRSAFQPWLIALAAGLIPVISANTAFLVNISAGLEGCFPYWEGCMSVSRGVRSGPGLVLFKILALPAALAMAWCWRDLASWLQQHGDPAPGRRRAMLWMGVAGAVFSLVYAAWLGTEGDFYKWLRRYGVVFYFGLTGLAQLVLLAVLWPRRRVLGGGRLHRAIVIYCGMVTLCWTLGVASAFKRKLIEDPAFLDRVENALAWDFALALSLAFVALAWVLRPAQGRSFMPPAIE